MAEKLKANVNGPNALSAAITDAGWLGAPVEAACPLRQGKTPSSLSLVLMYEERGSWGREAVSMSRAKKGMNSNAVLHLPGNDVSCAVPDGAAEGAFKRLLALLSR